MQVVSYKDKNYCFDEITVDVYDRLYDWAVANVPDPIEVLKARIKDLPPELAKMLADKAYDEIMSTKEKANPRIAAKMQSMEGCIKLCCFALQAKHSELTDSQALDVVCGLMNEKGIKWFTEIFWKLMPPAIRGNSKLEESFRSALEESTTQADKSVNQSGDNTKSGEAVLP